MRCRPPEREVVCCVLALGVDSRGMEKLNKMIEIPKLKLGKGKKNRKNQNYQKGRNQNQNQKNKKQNKKNKKRNQNAKKNSVFGDDEDEDLQNMTMWH